MGRKTCRRWSRVFPQAASPRAISSASSQPACAVAAMQGGNGVAGHARLAADLLAAAFGGAAGPAVADAPANPDQP